MNETTDMFNTISSTYDRVNRLLSFGLDTGWRKKLKEALPPGENLRLVDFATGTGDQLIELMNSGKFSEAVGFDLAEEMLKICGEKTKGLNVELIKASALDVPLPSMSFDCASISFGIRNVGDPAKCLAEMYRLLKEGGRALILEFSLPKSPLVKASYLLYLRRLLPVWGGYLSGFPEAYRYLNRTIESFPSGDAFCHLMENAGFASVCAHPLTMGVATLYVGVRP